MRIIKQLIWKLIPQRYTAKFTWFDIFDAFLASVRYGFPGRKLKVIGITGTDGKTTTSYFTHSILTSWGKSAGLITSIIVKIGNETFPTGLHVTTPDPWELNRILKKMVQEGCEYVVLETTSHAIHQHRIFGIPFEVAGLTNITPEHLDAHSGSFEKYKQTKLKLIRKAKNSFVTEEIPDHFVEGVQLKLTGEYNYLNAKLAAAICDYLGASTEVIQQGLESISNVPGRMELVYDNDFKAIIDFAHTPNGLKTALSSAKLLVPQGGRLISVFGSAGERDPYKRPELGRIAGEIADMVIITAEDPRSEKVEVISEEIAKGARESGKKDNETLFLIPDRTEAINLAVKLAKPHDVIMFTGKSHEQSMNFDGIEYPWDEFETVREAIEKVKQ